MTSAAKDKNSGATDAPAEGNPPSNTGLVLRRMIAERGRTLPVATAGAGGPVNIERAAATALGRAAERLHHLPVFIERVELAPISVPELSELFPERALLTVLEGTRDELGVMTLCPNFLASIIEMQAIGRVTSRPVSGRRPTRTDAAIAADFVNLLLAELGRELGSPAHGPNFAAYRYATYIDDPRALALMLEDGRMQRLSLHFRAGAGGQRDGSILIALPAPGGTDHRAPLPAVEGPAAPGAPAGAPVMPKAPTPRASLREAMQSAPVRLVGILCRRKLSLQTLRTLGPGSLIPLPQNVLDEARIETPGGQLLATGRLGESDGFHAIRLKQAAQKANRTGGKALDSSPGAAQPPAANAPAPNPAAQDQAQGTETAADPEPPIADLNGPDAFRSGKEPAKAPPQGNTG